MAIKALSEMLDRETVKRLVDELGPIRIDWSDVTPAGPRVEIRGGVGLTLAGAIRSRDTAGGAFLAE